MPTTCTDDDGGISAGDAVCVSGWDGAPNNRPKVKRALRANLLGANAKTVYGVATTDSAGPPSFVNVLIAGEVADVGVTGLSTGAGTSRLVVTDYDNASSVLTCRLRHIDDSPPVPERFVVGSSDETGTLAIQPRHASDETGFLQTFNVRAYGAVGDDVADDLPAFNAAMAAMSSVDPSIGAILEVPAGTYFLDGNLHIERRLVMRGHSTGNSFGSTLIHFAAGYGLFVERDNTSPDGGIRQRLRERRRTGAVPNRFLLVLRDADGSASVPGDLIRREQYPAPLEWVVP